MVSPRWYPSGVKRARSPESDHRWYVEERRRFARDAGIERFDRVAFALRTLEILKPRNMTVAVYQGRFELRIERGRHWGGPRGATWAMMSVPPDASREDIVFSIAELSDTPLTPWMLSTLLADPAPGERDASSGRARAAV
jgi:hypothetical protein